MEKMPKFNTRKNVKIFIKCAQNKGAHLQCLINHYAKFEYKGMKTIRVTVYTNLTPPTHFEWKKCLSSTPVEIRKYLSSVHKKQGAHVQCMNNQYAKFEYNRNENYLSYRLHKLDTPYAFWVGKCLSSTPIKNEKIFTKCAQNRRCTSLMYEQSLGKFEYKGMKTI